MLQAVIEPISNREDWIEVCEVRDYESNELVDLTGAAIVMAVRDKTSKVQVLNASTDDGTIIIQGLGTFRWQFPLSSMRGIAVSRSYEVGCTIQLNGGPTQQFFIGTVNVLDGIVP